MKKTLMLAVLLLSSVSQAESLVGRSLVLNKSITLRSDQVVLKKDIRMHKEDILPGDGYCGASINGAEKAIVLKAGTAFTIENAYQHLEANPEFPINVSNITIFAHAPGHDGLLFQISCREFGNYDDIINGVESVNVNAALTRFSDIVKLK